MMLAINKQSFGLSWLLVVNESRTNTDGCHQLIEVYFVAANEGWQEEGMEHDGTSTIVIV